MDKKELIDDIIINQDDFNYEDLFFEKKYRAGLKVITPYQEITVSADNHEEEARKIYKAIYDEVYDGYFGFWFSEKGAITVQFLDSGFILINIPEDGTFYLNSYQYDRLKQLSLDINYIDKVLINMGLQPLDIITNLSDERLTMDEILFFLNDFVYDYNRHFDELIISSFNRKNSK